MTIAFAVEIADVVIAGDCRPLAGKRESVPSTLMALLSGPPLSFPDSPANLKQCPSNRMAV